MNKYQLIVQCLTSLLESSIINPVITSSLRMTVHDLSLLFYFVVDSMIIAASLCMVLAGGIAQSIQRISTWTNGLGFEFP